MAAAHLKLTRRALLAGACAAPLLPSAPPAAGRPPPSTFPPAGVPAGQGTATPPDGDARSFVVTNWDRALARFQKAEAALAAAAHTSDEARYDRLGDPHESALQRLLLTPAPDIAALALKLDLALYEPAEEFLAGAPAMRALKADARRLAETR